MKKIIVVMLLVLFVSLFQVKATGATDVLPGGKNYLDSNNFTITNGTLHTINDFLVKADQDYTLTLPSSEMLGEAVAISIEGNSTYYYNDDVEGLSECTVSSTETICNFRTIPGEEKIYVSVSGSQVAQYFSYYGMDYFQLEEGVVSTTYEPYIIPFQDTTNPEFSGSGAYIKGYQSTETIEEIIANHVIAVDEIDGNISDQIIIVSNQYTGNEQVVGEYNVELYVEDSSGNGANFLLTIIVKDEILPDVIGPSSITVTVDDTPLIEDIILASFQISDDYDSSPVTTIVNDNYSINKSTIGHYEVMFDVTDNSLNTTSTTFTVIVQDQSAPILVTNSTYTSYLSNPLTTTDIYNSIQFTDNYDDLTDSSIKVISDTYSGNETTVGTYFITIQMGDSSGNITSETLTIEVVDDVAPIIQGPSTYTVSYIEDLTKDDLLELFTVSDNVDQISTTDITITTDTFTDRTSKIGTYEFSFFIEDTMQNVASHSLLITIIDDQKPIIYVDEYIVTLNTNSTFNQNDALNLLQMNHELDNDLYQITTLLDEYSGNESIPGEYLYKLGFTSEDGSTYEKEFLVQVKEIETTWNPDMVVRNIVLYSCSALILGIICYKQFR